MKKVVDEANRVYFLSKGGTINRLVTVKQEVKEEIEDGDGPHGSDGDQLPPLIEDGYLD
jgi:hypothetical protein